MMSSAQIPPLNIFIGKVISLNYLIPCLYEYLELLGEEIKVLEVYENPMLYVEKLDYYEKISTFLQLLDDEREGIENPKNESKDFAGADENGEENW